jgi:glycosyltransferase involved in cell wall biosynthesis
VKTCHLLVGSYSESIGGPYQTISNYASSLASQGISTRILGLRPDGVASSSDESVTLVRFRGPDPRTWWVLASAVFVRRRSPIIMFGVWHPVFMLDGLIALIFRPRARRTLVPTQSLSPIDWRKHQRRKRALLPFVKLVLSTYDSVIFASVGEQRMSYPSVACDRSHVIYHPVKPVDVGQESGPHLPGQRIVFLGRVVEQKDLHLFIESLAALPPEWTADVVGDGAVDYLQSCRDAALLLGCGQRIRWHGWLTRQAAHNVTRGADALLVTSIDENYCHAAVEAMALDVPVVMVSRAAAAVDLRLNSTGWVVEALPNTIADLLVDLHEQPDRLATVKQNARAFALARQTGADDARLAAVVWPYPPADSWT